MRNASKRGFTFGILTFIILLGSGLNDGMAMSTRPQIPTSQEETVPSGTEYSTPAVLVSDESLTEAGTGSVGYGLRAAGAMIIVLSMIWGTMFLLKRYMPHRFGPLGHKRRIHVLETVPLGEKRALTLIRIDNEELLLAGTPGSVSLLKEIRLEPETANPVQTETTPAPNQKPSDSTVTVVEPDRKFEDVLADQVRTVTPAPLSRLTLLRQELEAR
jgi:flagellar biosynthetic protein FliO